MHYNHGQYKVEIISLSFAYRNRSLYYGSTPVRCRCKINPRDRLRLTTSGEGMIPLQLNFRFPMSDGFIPTTFNTKCSSINVYSLEWPVEVNRKSMVSFKNSMICHRDLPTGKRCTNPACIPGMKTSNS